METLFPPGWRPDPIYLGVGEISALLVECFKHNLLMVVSKTINKAIKIDLTTQEAVRGKYARACVEVNLAKTLLPSVTLYGRRQLVEYEGLHQICFQCGRYGHRVEGCPNAIATNEGDDQGDTTKSFQPTESI